MAPNGHIPCLYATHSTSASSMTSSPVQPNDKPWELNLINIASVKPPSKSNDNALFTRDECKPVQLSVSDYRRLRQDGFLKVEGLIPPDCQQISEHMDSVIQGKETANGFPAIYPSMPEAERVARFSRVHNAHRVHPLHKRFLLHPGILDVLEQVNGPDVLALQSMMFFKQPGQPGQGYVAKFLVSFLPITQDVSSSEKQKARN